MKKTLSLLLLTGIMIFACMAVGSAEAADPERFVSGDYTYVLNEDGTAYLTAFHPEAYPFTLVNGERILTLPETIDGIVVTGLGPYTLASSFRKSYRSQAEMEKGIIVLEIPASLALVNELSLQHVDAVRVSPKNETFAVVDDVLFHRAEKKLVFYPKAKKDAFYEIPEGTQTIGEGAFYNCGSLTGILIPDSITRIEGSAFSHCTGLTAIVIPGSVTELGYFAFSGCESLTDAVISDGVTGIGDGVFMGCNTLTSIVLPNNMTKIGDAFFQGCDSLTTVVIPGSVTEIGVWAFFGCYRLTDIVIPDSVTEIWESAFESCTGLVRIVIPDGVATLRGSVFYECDSLAEVVIPGSVTAIGECAFVRCYSLTTLTIPDSVVSIDDLAFLDCEDLTLTVGRGSYAERYAMQNDIPYTYAGL